MPLLPSLLFVTNPANSDPEEDAYLSKMLERSFEVRVTDPIGACLLLPHHERCLIRNAWPSRLFVEAYRRMKALCDESNVRVYTPFHRNNYIEDKTYIVDLFREGYAVIPTVDQIEDVSKLPEANSYTIKPKDGCSSYGVRSIQKEALLLESLENHIIQPTVEFLNEYSFFFIDGEFVYALASAEKYQRWDLSEFTPTPEELDWARTFVRWNNLPYGLERIDACHFADGSLLLMEIESENPFLSLLDISEATRTMVVNRLEASLLKHLD